MKHITEDQMLDYSGNELNPEELSAAERHLAECADCREAMARLQADLSAISAGFPGEPDTVFWAAYPVRLRDRMAGHGKRTAPIFLPEWITALSGVSFAVTLVFMLVTGKMYLTETPFSYEEWRQAYVYQPVDAAESEDLVDSALAQVMEAEDLDFMTVNEADIYQLLDMMSEEELTALFKNMEDYSMNVEG